MGDIFTDANKGYWREKKARAKAARLKDEAAQREVEAMGDGQYHAWKEQRDKEDKEKLRKSKQVTGHSAKNIMRVISLSVPQEAWETVVQVFQNNGMLLHDTKVPEPDGGPLLDVWIRPDTIRTLPLPDQKGFFLEPSNLRTSYDRADVFIHAMVRHTCPDGGTKKWTQDHTLGRTVWDSHLGFQCRCGVWVGITQATFQALPNSWDSLLSGHKERDLLATRTASDKENLLGEVEEMDVGEDVPKLTREDLQEALGKGKVFVHTDHGLQAAPEDILS